MCDAMGLPLDDDWVPEPRTDFMCWTCKFIYPLNKLASHCSRCGMVDVCDRCWTRYKRWYPHETKWLCADCEDTSPEQ